MSDQMPPEVATALLTSGQSMTARFRKNCLRSRERVAQPQSRSTALAISAPKTAAQRFQSRLARMNVRQLVLAHKRALRRGNRLSDIRDVTTDAEAIEFLTQQVQACDALCEAVQSELDNRRNRGNIKT